MSLANFFTGEDDFADAANLYASTISTIDRLEEEGELDEEEAEESRAVSYEQYQDLLEELEAMYEAEDDEDDEDEEYEEYSGYSPLATFRSGDDLGDAVIGLIEETYEDPEEGVYDIADITGQDPQTILAIMSGEAVPDEILADQLVEAFDLSEDEADGFYTLVAQDYEDSGYGEPYDEEDEVDAQYSAAFSQLHRQNQDLEAKFSAMEYERALDDHLINQELRARQGIGAGWLPPFVYRAEFSGFESSSDRLATFSAMCATNGVDPEAELYHRDKLLDLLERNGSVIQFGEAAYEDIEDELEDDEEDELLVEIAQNNAAYISGMHGLADPAE